MRVLCTQRLCLNTMLQKPHSPHHTGIIRLPVVTIHGSIDHIVHTIALDMMAPLPMSRWRSHRGPRCADVVGQSGPTPNQCCTCIPETTPPPTPMSPQGEKHHRMFHPTADAAAQPPIPSPLLFPPCYQAIPKGVIIHHHVHWCKDRL